MYIASPGDDTIYQILVLLLSNIRPLQHRVSVVRCDVAYVSRRSSPSESRWYYPIYVGVRSFSHASTVRLRDTSFCLLRMQQVQVYTYYLHYNSNSSFVYLRILYWWSSMTLRVGTYRLIYDYWFSKLHLIQ